jgi:putative transposase
MRPYQCILTHTQVYQFTQQHLQAHLRLSDYSSTCSHRTLWAVVLVAAAQLSSLSAVCQRLWKAPSDETVRKALLATLPAQAELQRRINQGLAALLPKALKRRRQRVAIDLTLIPYHGEPLEKENEVYRSHPRDGTSHFHAYATAYVIRHGQRFTVAMTAVARGEDMATVVKLLLRQTARTGLKASLVLLDRGFYSVAVIRYLQHARYPFVMPVVCRGRKPDHAKGPSGTQMYRTWKKSGWDSYTITDAKKQTATVAICVKCRNYRGQWKRQGRQALVFACWGFGRRSPEWVRQTYRQRFAIETSYRQMHQARIRTCSRSPVVRLFLVGVALLLRNVWVWLHYEVLATPRRGHRLLHLERLRLEGMMLWLQHVIEEAYGVCDRVATEHVLEPNLRPG